MGYDPEFCTLRQDNRSLPWNFLSPQLYMMSGLCNRLSKLGQPADVKLNDTASHKMTQAARQVFWWGYCIHFNLHGTCRCIPKCAHLIHRCTVCKGPHAALQCKPMTTAAATSTPSSVTSNTPQKWGTCPNLPVIPDELNIIVQGHPDSDFLVQGFRDGFSISHADFALKWSSCNHASAGAHESLQRQYIESKLQSGRILGPFS